MNLFNSALLVAAAVVSVSAFADAAKKVDLTYAPATMELTVKAEHGTKDVMKHYIDYLEFFVDGKLIHKENFKEQSSKSELTFTYKLVDVKPGATIKVLSNCNKGGKKSAEMVIPAK